MRSELDFLYDKLLLTRLRVAYFIVIFTFGILFLRLWYLQVIEGASYRRLSEHNYIRIQKIKAPRGIIYDCKGRVLAGNRPSFDICLVPQEAGDLRSLLARLASLLECDPSPLEEKVVKAKGRPPFEPIKLKTDVSRNILSRVLTHRLELPGIVIEPIPVRFYPYGSLASHLLGYLGEISPGQLSTPEFYRYKPGELIGKAGVEQYAETYLKGTDGAYQAEVDAVGYKINTTGRIDPIPAHNVILTIDIEIQRIAEERLKGLTGAAIALDPRNGKILALASSPSFDPNLFSRGITSRDWEKLTSDPHHPLMNRGIQSTHPPGSTYKLVAAAAALEENLIRPGTSFFCGGSLRCGNRHYRCWKEGGHGSIDLKRALAESCDVYFYNVGLLLGPDLLAKYARGFGLGEKTGIPLFGERPGFIPTSGWYQTRYGIPWQPGESLSIAIGQGSNQVTPLQLLLAYSAIANGGRLYKPFFIERITSAQGETLKRFHSSSPKIIPLSQKNIEIIRDALFEVVNAPSGTGWRARLSHIGVAGKTGTAQVVGLGKWGRHPTGMLKDHAWFVAFAPKENARIAVVVLVEHGGHGGAVAAPIAKDILSAFFALEETGNV